MRTPYFSDLIEDIVNNYLSELHTSLPARIVTYDHATQNASVLPLIKRRYFDAGNNTDGLVDMPIIEGVPVIFPSANTGILTFPIKQGDIVLLVFCERSIDNWVFSDGSEPVDPQDLRKHNYSDAFCIPGLYPFSKALGSHETDTVLRFNVGTANENKISLKPNGDVQIDTPAKLIVNATSNVEITTQADAIVNVSGNADVNVTGSTTVDSNGVTVNSSTSTFNGDVQVNGTLTATTDVIGGGKSLKTHTHSGVTPGSGTSGPPV